MMTARRLFALGLASVLLAGTVGVWCVCCYRPLYDLTSISDATPTALVAEQREWDFGPVRQESEPLTHAFTLTNRGATPVALKLRRVGCGCMSVRCPESMPPGSSATVEVSIDPRAKFGPFTGPAEIETSDPAAPSVAFRVRADAVPACAVIPDALEFLDVEAGQAPEREFAVVIRQEAGAQEPPAPQSEPGSSAFRCEYRGRESAGEPTGLRRVTHRFAVRLNADAWLASTSSDNATVPIRLAGIGAPTEPRVAIRVTRRYHPTVSGPTSVVLYRGRSGEAAVLRFWSRDGSPLAIAEVRPSSPRVTATVGDGQPARVAACSVALRADAVAVSETEKGHFDVCFAGRLSTPYRVEYLILP
jgi:hypothetical protein